MTKKLNKRGFTIVELVVVIVVIAILAAVLIPTVSTLINKANRSADEQAVAQMNKALAIKEIEEPVNITKVYDALESFGMDAKDYTPLAKDSFFFWDSALNRIVYTNDSYEVIYPTDLGAKKANGWYSLNGTIKEQEVTPESGTYKVSNAEQLYWVANQVNDKKITGNVKIELAEGEIDLMGANVTFVVNPSGETTSVTGFELKGLGNGATIKHLSQLTASTQWDGATGEDFSSGLISRLYLPGGDKSGVIENITISDSIIGDSDAVQGCAGVLVGEILSEGSQFTISNCKVNNCTVSANYYVGGLIGQVQSYAKVSITECSVEGVTVNCKSARSGMAIGAIYSHANVKLDKKFGEWVKNTTLNLVKGDTDYEWFTVAEYEALDSDYKAATNASTVVKTKRENGEYRYHMFCSKAYATVSGIAWESENSHTYVGYGNDENLTPYITVTSGPQSNVAIPYFITE